MSEEKMRKTFGVLEEVVREMKETKFIPFTEEEITLLDVYLSNHLKALNSVKAKDIVIKASIEDTKRVIAGILKKLEKPKELEV